MVSLVKIPLRKGSFNESEKNMRMLSFRGTLYRKRVYQNPYALYAAYFSGANLSCVRNASQPQIKRCNLNRLYHNGNFGIAGLCFLGKLRLLYRAYRRLHSQLHSGFLYYKSPMQKIQL